MPEQDSYIDAEDLARKEEEQTLADVEDKLRQDFDYYDGRVNEINYHLANYFPVDIEDRTFRMVEVKDLAQYEEWREEVSTYFDSPYFGHIDCQDEDGPITVLIGKSLYRHKGKTLIVDWRSPMGGSFYNKQSKNFKVKGHEYELLLRRALTIEGGALKACITEFDSAASDLAGDVVDPFLISVLRDKRRDYKLTDIIKTIQENQNEIMRLPSGEAFIVQGCAGSGKTMILLHRLSYLWFNEPEIDFSKYLIITPSDTFSEHIDELGVQLGLDKIRRCTAEALYAGLIDRLSLADTEIIETANGRQERRKIAPIEALDYSEACLGNNLLGEIYSPSYKGEIIDLFAGVREDALGKIADSGTLEFLESRAQDKLPLNGAPFTLYSALKRAIRNIRESLGEAKREVLSAKEKHEKSLADLAAGEKRLRDAETTIAPYEAALHSEIPQAIASLEARRASRNKALEKAQSTLTLETSEAATCAKTAQTAKERATSCNSIIEEMESAQSAASLLASSNPAISGQAELIQNLKESLAREKAASQLAEEQAGLANQTRDAIAALEEQLASEQARLSNISELGAAEDIIGEISRVSSPTTRLLENAFRADFERIQSVTEQLNSLGLLAFGAKRRQRAEIQALEASLQDKLRQHLQALKSEASEQCQATTRLLEQSRQILDEHQASAEAALAAAEAEKALQLTAATDALSSIAHACEQEAEEALAGEKAHADLAESAQNEVTRIQEQLEDIEVQTQYANALFAALEQHEHPEPKEDKVRAGVSAYADAYAAYRSNFFILPATSRDYLLNGKARIAKLVENEASSRLAREEADAKMASDSDLIALSKAESLLGLLDVRAYLDELDSMLALTYEKHGLLNHSSKPYRHMLLMKLILCAYYYGPQKGASLRVSIDEAQDFAETELETIKEALPAGSIFNLYGDTRQLICPFKGIKDWGNVAHLLDAKICTLNENYRNTLQITSYCNECFDTETTGIGLSGAEVKTLRINDALQELFSLRSANKSLRLAIIFKRGLVGFREEFGNFMGNDAAWFKVDPTKISIIDVEASKGLEFDAAIVVTNEMTENERYIAYTRALDNLIVSSIYGLTEVSLDTIEGMEVAIREAPQQSEPAPVPAKPTPKPAPKMAAKEPEPEPEPEEDLFAEFSDIVFEIDD